MLLMIHNYDLLLITWCNTSANCMKMWWFIATMKSASSRSANCSPDHRHFSRPVHAQRGGHLSAAHRVFRRKNSDTGCVLRPSGHRPGVGRKNRARAAHHARQDLSHPSQRRRRIKGLPNPFQATRYHSLVIERASLPDCLKITAWTDDGEIDGRTPQDTAY